MVLPAGVPPLDAFPVTPLIPVVVVFQTHLPLQVPLSPLVQLDPLGPLKRVQVPVPSLHVHEKVPVTFFAEAAKAVWLPHSEDESIREVSAAKTKQILIGRIIFASPLTI